MFRLAYKDRWIRLPHGVRLHVRPATTVAMAAAQAAARRQAAQIVSDAPEDDALRRGIATMLTIQALGRELIRAWEGVVDENGAPVPCTPEAIDALLAHEEMAVAFFDEVVARTKAIEAEGNGFGPAPSGTSATGRNIVTDA